MPAISVIITDAGLALLPANGGTAPVLLSEFGVSEVAMAATPATTALTDELKRLPITAGEATSPNTVALTLMDASNDTYAMRTFGIYASDGTLFALYSQPTPVANKASGADMIVSLDIAFAAIDAAELVFGDTNFLLPSATTEREGLVELATSAETAAGTDTTRAVTARAISDMLTAAFLAGRMGYNAADVLAKLLTVDGAGSGLDSALLAGQAPSYYTNIIARLGYTPLNQTAYNAADVLAKLLTVDGAGSGLDAALLAGQPLSAFVLKSGGGTQIIGSDLIVGLEAAAGSEGGQITFARAPSGTATQNPALDIYNDGFRFVSYMPGASIVTLPFGSGGTIIHTGSDGSGCGFDADLLDGQHGSFYLNLSNATGTLPNAALSGAYSFGSLTLSGSLSAGGAIQRDSYFYLNLLSGNPLIHFDPDDYIIYNRSSNDLRVILDAATRFNVTTAGAFVLGNTVWHAGNDGAGSALDAGLLAGQLPAYYTDIIARLGYSPVRGDAQQNTARNAGIIAAGLSPTHGWSNAPVQIREIDYVGSAQTDAQWAPALAFHWASTVAGALKLWSDGTFRFMAGVAGDPAALRSVYAANFFAGTNQVWHAGNDGAGSALDAGLLGGYLPSAYRRVVASNTAENGGYTEYSDGLIETWTKLTIAQDSSVVYNLPRAHSQWCNVTIGRTGAGGTSDSENVSATVNGNPPTSITVWNAENRTNTVWLQTKGK